MTAREIQISCQVRPNGAIEPTQLVFQSGDHLLDGLLGGVAKRSSALAIAIFSQACLQRLTGADEVA